MRFAVDLGRWSESSAPQAAVERERCGQGAVTQRRHADLSQAPSIFHHTQGGSLGPR